MIRFILIHGAPGVHAGYQLKSRRRVERPSRNSAEHVISAERRCLCGEKSVAVAIDFEKEPPMFKVSDTHYAATWLLHPNAPKVNRPEVLERRIANSIKRREGKVNG